MLHVLATSARSWRTSVQDPDGLALQATFSRSPNLPACSRQMFRSDGLRGFSQARCASTGL